MKLPDPGFNAVVNSIANERANQPMLGHSFVGYRRRVFDQFFAVFELSGNSQELDKFTCEQITANAKPGTEPHEAAQLALKHWPRA